MCSVGNKSVSGEVIRVKGHNASSKGFCESVIGFSHQLLFFDKQVLDQKVKGENTLKVVSIQVSCSANYKFRSWWIIIRIFRHWCFSIRTFWLIRDGEFTWNILAGMSNTFFNKLLCVAVYQKANAIVIQVSEHYMFWNL